MQRKHGKSPLLPRTLRVGVSRTIGLAYLPGFFRAFQRKLPDAQLQVSHQPSNFILAAVESGELDAGIVSLPPRVPSAVELARQFNDEFVLILPPHSTVKFPQPLAAAKLTEVLKRQRWLLITRQSNTGKRLHAWLQDCGLRREPAIEADNFDFIVNLVSLGLGASLVPHRVLALHPGTRPVTRIRTEPRFSRQLAVIVRRQADQPELVSTFVENLLF